MAQRIFSGMLNESLTILTVRYTQVTLYNRKHINGQTALKYDARELIYSNL